MSYTVYGFNSSTVCIVCVSGKVTYFRHGEVKRFSFMHRRYPIMSPFCFLASGGCQNICNIFDPMLFACTDVGGPDGAARKLECNSVRI